MRQRWLAGLMVAALLSGCGLQQDISTRTDLGASSLQTLPPLSGSTLQGGSFALAAHRGHPVVVDSWASWCGPCRKQQPDLDAIARCYLPAGVVFIGVDLRDDDANGRAYIRSLVCPIPAFLTPAPTCPRPTMFRRHRPP